jgi:hypothetical protein
LQINFFQQLTTCLSNHTPTNAQIRQNCLAGDNIHKKAASGDINFVTKCLNAGVSVDTSMQNYLKNMGGIRR